MSCARCGCGIYKTEEFISLNKVWHKYCFTCYQCNKRLDKDTAKIFQGELFCQCCYTNVIEKLFKVLSTPSINKPCKVASTPSCAVTNDNCFEQRLRNCEALLKVNEKPKEYCFPVETKTQCVKKAVQSCSCIPSENEKKNEYCFIFPIPREVANYYNRAHMNTKSCKDPTYNAQPQFPKCSCRSSCSPPKCQVQVRTLDNQKCFCNSSPPTRCRNSSPQRCCCFSAPKPPKGPVTFSKDCGCSLPSKPVCCEPCPPPKRYASPIRSCSPPCQQCRCCKKEPQSCIEKKSFQASPCCRSPQNYVLPPRSTQCCAPPPRCPQRMEGCCCTKSNQSSENSNKCCCAKSNQLPENSNKCCCIKSNQTSENSNKCCCMKSNQSSENSKCCCKKPTNCSCQKQKYCICGNLNPCSCKMSQIKAQCTIPCIRCRQKVYAAEKILVSSGAYHTSCFTCYCCNKCLDVINVFEGCGEIYCKQCYNHFFGVEYYGFGGRS